MARLNVVRIVRQKRVWLTLLLLATAGCAQKGQVSGKVKYRGNALPSGTVTFFDSNDRRIGNASISTDGSYSAILPSGLVKIGVITPTATLQSIPKEQADAVVAHVKKMKKGFNPFEGAAKDVMPEKTIPIPAKYGDPAGSGLSFTVLGGPQTFDIDLH